MVKIKSIPAKDRPREKFLKKGAENLSKSELLAILLGSGIKNKNAKELADQIIKTFGSKFLEVGISDLQKIKGVGEVKAFQIVAAFKLVDRLLNEEKPKLKRKIQKEIQQASLFDVNKKPKSNKKWKKDFKFIDLFAGIGGFHVAAEELGGTCVLVSEFDKEAEKTYRENFAKKNKELFEQGGFVGDITDVNEETIPNFNFLFAGFPCQPFSKGGYRKGFEDTRGTLFFDIARIVKYHKPEFLLLENVSNLVTHDSGKTFRTIIEVLGELGYALNIEPLILSPHDFGVPAIRQRIFIPAIRKDILGNDVFNLDFANDICDVESDAIYTVVDKTRKASKYYISEYEKKVLKVWDDFYQGINLNVIGFPIWMEEFRKSYELTHLPEWKKNFILKNRTLYQDNKKFIDFWLKKNNDLDWMVPTHRKMEWQAGGDIENIYQGLIQFRPSGVRVKRPDKFSTLVAMNHPQIIGKFGRRLTPNEAKRLQSFPEWFRVHDNDAIALKQLGNAVNVDVVKRVVTQMFNLV